MSQTWQRRRAPADHTDDWLMTYADMITLLLCFFAIFLSVSIPKKDVQKVQIPHPTEEPSRKKDVLKGDLPFYGLPHLSQPTDDKGDFETPVRRGKSLTESTEPVVLTRDSERPLPDDKTVSDVIVPVQGAEKAYPSLMEIVARLKLQGGDGLAHLEKKNDSLTTLEMSSGAFFAVGSAVLSEAGKEILRGVAANIKSDAYQGYQATVEGHTDDSPINTPQFPSNWELSTARAAAVVRFLLEQGVLPQKLRAAGYADTFPVAPNRDAAGRPIADNQARNRRVVIKLEKLGKLG